MSACINTKGLTGSEAGLSGDEQIMLCLDLIIAHRGSAEMSRLYEPVEADVCSRYGVGLSEQGRASLRFFINKKAVSQHLVHAYDPNSPGWKITEYGKVRFKLWRESENGRKLLKESRTPWSS